MTNGDLCMRRRTLTRENATDLCMLSVRPITQSGGEGCKSRRCGISVVGKLAPRSLAHIWAKDLGADIPWSENISTFSNRGVSSDSRRIESWRLEARRIFTHSVILGASCARNLRARIPCAKVPTAENLCAKNPSSILSPPSEIYLHVRTSQNRFSGLKNSKSQER